MPPTPASAPARSAGTRAVRVALTGSIPAGHEALLVRDDVHPFALVGRWAGGGALVGSEPLRIAGPDDDPFALLTEGSTLTAAVPNVPADATPGSAAFADSTLADATPGNATFADPTPADATLADAAFANAPSADATSALTADPAALPDEAALRSAAFAADPPTCSGEAADRFVGGGWVGYLGFGLGAPAEALDPPPPVRERLPAFALAHYDHLLHLDADGRWWFEALWTPERDEPLTARLEILRARLKDGVGAPGPVSTRPWRADPSPAGHALAVAACRERIAAGDLYQANLSLRLRSSLAGDPADLFARGVAALGPDRAAFLAGDWGAVASLSPELFLERHGDHVRSAPIKGTRRRPKDPSASAAARAELLASEKDAAENVMIVDLVRNDLGRVCVPGTVHVTARAQARAHPGVWHLVSEVEGELADGVDDAALLRATFPPGSVTGAPKLAALATIAELESAARQTFTGAIGFASPVAGLELNVAIRTFEVSGDDVWLDVGGGIVADSDPESEAAEALVKARPLLEAIAARLQAPSKRDTPPGATDPATTLAHAPDTVPVPDPGVAAPGPRAPDAASTSAPGRDAGAPAPGTPAPLRLGPRPLPRPDPAAGVFDTILVRDGNPVALDRHLDRLRASMAALYGTRPDHDLEQRARAAAAAAGGACRLRLTAGPPDTGAPATRQAAPLPPDSGAPVTVETAPLPPDTGALAVAPVTVPGGLGPHKWRDRRLLDALAAATAPAIPLLIDLDGHVLEAMWANVLIVTADGALATPPLDGRILPGVTRELVLQDARARGKPVAERPIALAELGTASEVLLTSSLRGTVRVAL